MRLRGNFNVLGKTKKSEKLFLFQYKRKLQKLIRWGGGCCQYILQNKIYLWSRFMARSLSNLVDNLAEGIHKIKRKDCDYFLEYESVKNNLIKYKY